MLTIDLDDENDNDPSLSQSEATLMFRPVIVCITRFDKAGGGSCDEYQTKTPPVGRDRSCLRKERTVAEPRLFSPYEAESSLTDARKYCSSLSLLFSALISFVEYGSTVRKKDSTESGQCGSCCG
jgi:hypothetical protein